MIAYNIIIDSHAAPDAHAAAIALGAHAAPAAIAATAAAPAAAAAAAATAKALEIKLMNSIGFYNTKHAFTNRLLTVRDIQNLCMCTSINTTHMEIRNLEMFQKYTGLAKNLINLDGTNCSGNHGMGIGIGMAIGHVHGHGHGHWHWH